MDIVRYHYVYEITNLVNGMKYIGKRSCSCPIEDDKYMGSGIVLGRAIKKYGKNNFKKTVIEVCLSEEEAYKREAYWINHYDAVKSRKFYNVKEGGLGNTREDALRNMKNMTPEQKEERSRKLSIANKGENNSMYGIKGKDNPVSKAVVMLSFDGKLEKEFECIREVNEYFNKARCFSLVSKVCIHGGTAYNHLWLFKDDYVKMINDDMFNEWLTYTQNRYVKRTIKVNTTRKKVLGKPVYQLDKDTLEIINKFNSIKEASETIGVKTTSISRNCRHGCNTASGYSWIFIDEYNSLTKEELKKLYSYKPAKGIKRPKTKRKVICLNTGQVFDGLVDATEYFNLCKGAKIDAVCRGTRKTAGKHPSTKEGLKWMYYDDYLKYNNQL